MAWRIHDSVIEGEIDNRTRGIITGKVWLQGLEQPVVLHLKGNACPDLAGCLLSFKNPGKVTPLRTDAHFGAHQQGTVGDLTASRKVRVLDVPLDEASARKKSGLPVPEHWANCLYLEWFSEANGRVVIESTEYEMAISGPAWKLTEEEERHRQREAEAGFNGFIEQLSNALQAAKHDPPADKEWDEFDYERLLRESDARTDKYMELLEKYGDSPEAQRRIAREMGWEWLEEALEQKDEESRLPPLDGTDGLNDLPAGEELEEGAEDPEEDAADGDELNQICSEAAENPPQPDPATFGVDWIRDEDGDVCHPLSLRAFNSSMKLWNQCDELGMGVGDDPDVARLISEFQITVAKLAGALDSLAYGRDTIEGAFIVAYLKRGLSHLHAGLAALDKVDKNNRLPREIVSFARAELFAIRQEMLRLMDEFRGRK